MQETAGAQVWGATYQVYQSARARCYTAPRMRRIDRTIRTAGCAVALATLCAVAMGQAAVDAAKAAAVDQKPPALDQQPLAQQIAALVAQPAVARAHWGVMVTTLDGTPIYALNDGQFFQPASNTKLFTTSAAMALLGPDQTFETQVAGTLDAASAAVTGDLSIVGAGDANLSGRQLPYVIPRLRPSGDVAAPAPDPLRYIEELADQVAAKGVKRVTGDVVGYDTLFPWEPYPSDWTIDDAVWGYGAPVSALTINDNQLKVTVTPAAAPGKTAAVTVVPAMAYYTLDVSQLHTQPAKSGSHVQFERAPGSKILRIYGSIAVDSPPDVEEVAIQDPAEYTAMALKEMLEARGITVSGTARAGHWLADEQRGFLEQTKEPLGWGLIDGTVLLSCGPEFEVRGGSGMRMLAAHRSATLAEDITVTNKVSQNLHAELLLHLLGVKLTCIGSTAQGARVVRGFLEHAGIDKDDFVFYDGSGLSGHDLVTPRATAKLLSYAAHDPKTGAPQPWFAEWKASLPLGGEDTDLLARFAKAPLKDHVFAKTGTLGEARALSGYLDCASGQTVIFSIMDSNHTPGSNADRDAMDKIVAAIAAAE